MGVKKMNGLFDSERLLAGINESHISARLP